MLLLCAYAKRVPSAVQHMWLRSNKIMRTKDYNANDFVFDSPCPVSDQSQSRYANTSSFQPTKGPGKSIEIYGGMTNTLSSPPSFHPPKDIETNRSPQLRLIPVACNCKFASILLAIFQCKCILRRESAQNETEERVPHSEFLL